jgi:hypothetical protein
LLSALFLGRKPVRVGEILAFATHLFGIPRHLVAVNVATDQMVDYDAATGFESPETVYLPSELDYGTR